MGSRDGYNVLLFPHVEALSETTSEADLLADSTAYIAHLTADQKDRLIAGLLSSVYGPTAFRRTEDEALHWKQIVRAVKDELEGMAMEVLGL
jgi:hypothetical protein